MMNERNNNINLNQEFKTPEQLKASLEKINNSFNNYLISLIQDFDENPKTIQNSVKYSTELIDDFKNFYKEFNILGEDILNNNPNLHQENKNNMQNPNERNKIYIDNTIVKDLDNSIKIRNDKLENLTKENDIKISKYLNELKDLPALKINKK